MISSKYIRASGFDVGTLMQHSGIGGFRKWDDILILYHSSITKTVYCTAIIGSITNWFAVASCGTCVE